jgi:hypothetical protein
VKTNHDAENIGHDGMLNVILTSEACKECLVSRERTTLKVPDMFMISDIFFPHKVNYFLGRWWLLGLN